MKITINWKRIVGIVVLIHLFPLLLIILDYVHYTGDSAIVKPIYFYEIGMFFNAPRTQRLQHPARLQ